MTFDEAFLVLIGHEGGLVNHPRDPGGVTKYGISQRAYPGEDIPGMTLERAKQIYQRDYWGPAGCDAVPDGVKFSLFDMAVNSGVKPAIKCLQRAVGVTDDGVLGPLTLQAVASIHPSKFIARFNGHRLQFMSGLSNWPAFGRGWANRIAKNLMEA
jgi:lysozyme family protein